MKRECSNCRRWKDANTRELNPNVKRCDEPDSSYYGRYTRGEMTCPGLGEDPDGRRAGTTV